MLGLYINVANYLDANGVELYRDRPREEWPRAGEGEVAIFTSRLDLESLLGELDD
jgi:catechol-2,3-dioxygenase